MSIRLLQFSDIHFGAENVAAVEAAASFAHATPFDLLILCGDITQLGHGDEFSAAGRWVSSLPRPWLSTPGNHDTPWMGLVDRVVRPFQDYAQAIGPIETGFNAPEIVVQTLNTARGWQIRLNWSKGQISRRQAVEAAGRLRVASPGAARILVCHHPLVEPAGEPITARVRGGGRAARRLVSAGVDLILSGHLHTPFVQPLPFGDQLTYAVGAGTLSLRERGAPPSFNIIDIGGKDLVVTAMAYEGGHLDEYRRWTMPLRPRHMASAPN